MHHLCRELGLVLLVVLAAVGPPRLWFCTAVRQPDNGNGEAVPPASLHHETWTHHVVMDAENAYHLYWTPSPDEVTFQIEVATTGYVAFGLSPNGGMAGSDIMIAWVANDGHTYLQDRYSEGRFAPKLDHHQDWELLGSEENGTHTIIRFKRKLITCDSEDLSITNDTMRLIYAYHNDDPKSDKNIMYHGRYHRGSRSLVLLQSRKPYAPIESPIYTWDIRTPSLAIPHNRDTTYWCKVYKAPSLGKKHHIIKIEPIIHPGNERFVHHMLLYHCLGAVGRELEPYVKQKGTVCYEPNMPVDMQKCEAAYAAWAIGGEPLILPEHAGLPLGEDDTVYFMLEIHYDNPFLYAGVIDTSGLRIYYTPQLREYDATTLIVGATVEPTVIIPPHQNKFILAGRCDPRCLAHVMPPEGIKLFAVLMHAHLLGRKIIARHYRNGTELPHIAQDHSYDFNYQEYRYLPNEVTVLPGDTLVVECTYNSTERNITTFGGLATRQEMCLGFFFYYPKMATGPCLSAATGSLVRSLLGVEELYPNTGVIKLPLSVQNQSYLEYIAFHQWNEAFIPKVEESMRFGPHRARCYKGNGEKLELATVTHYPEYDKPYEEPNPCPVQEAYTSEEKLTTSFTTEDRTETAGFSSSSFLLSTKMEDNPNTPPTAELSISAKDDNVSIAAPLATCHLSIVIYAIIALLILAEK